MPSKRHTGSTTRQQPQPTPAIEPPAADPVTDEATSGPTDSGTPEEPAAEPQADPVQPDDEDAETSPEPFAADGDDDADQPSGEQSADPVEVRLGSVIGVLHRLPLGEVLAHADLFAEKIEAMTNTAPVRDLQARMRASEGRCAPVYFSCDNDGEPEHLVAGDDALSCAKAIGLEQVFVILIAPGDVGTVQSYLAGQAGSMTASTDDDELVWRAYHAEQEESASPA